MLWRSYTTNAKKLCWPCRKTILFRALCFPTAFYDQPKIPSRSLSIWRIESTWLDSAFAPTKRVTPCVSAPTLSQTGCQVQCEGECSELFRFCAHKIISVIIPNHKGEPVVLPRRIERRLSESESDDLPVSLREIGCAQRNRTALYASSGRRLNHFSLSAGVGLSPTESFVLLSPKATLPLVERIESANGWSGRNRTRISSINGRAHNLYATLQHCQPSHSLRPSRPARFTMLLYIRACMLHSTGLLDEVYRLRLTRLSSKKGDRHDIGTRT